MKIIIEEYQYAVEDVKDILWEGAFQTVDGKVSINYVGYYFNPRQGVNDCVFILPKVLLEVGSDKVERIYGKKIFNSRQFENRLFDRDTLLVAHYDVNFLFVVSLYARDSISQKSAWKSKVRRMFRAKIQEMLKDKFEFYAMTLLAILTCRDCWRTVAVNRGHPSSSAHRFILKAENSFHIGADERCRTSWTPTITR